ncbi:MAG: metal ABC transporter substrate-binding protein [Nitrospirota bacterium]|nr:metal ABC transporter substrate-binding protein [Nitrospirota bacterium]
MKRFANIFCALALLFVFAGCSKGPEQASKATDKPLVITTFFPLYDFAKNVAGDRMRVENLLPAGAGPHEFTFTPKDRQRLENARLLIKNGFGLETFLEDVTLSPDKTLVVEAGKGIAPLELKKKEDHRDEHEHVGGHHHEGGDPHVWLDPVNAMKQVENIRDAMIAVDPANKTVYEANAVRYLDQLRALDEECRREIEGFARKEFVAYHSAFSYFSNRYGLKQVAVFEEVPGKEPSPRSMAGLINTIKKYNVRALFTEPQFSPRIIQTVASDLKLSVLELDPMETGDFEKGSYIGVMKKNLAAFKEAQNKP